MTMYEKNDLIIASFFISEFDVGDSIHYVPYKEQFLKKITKITITENVVMYSLVYPDKEYSSTTYCTGRFILESKLFEPWGK